tara:strand:- start:4172 stop:4438 length:267 start_codon:yes stop_codon:yes gene_type:complete
LFAFCVVRRGINAERLTHNPNGNGGTGDEKPTAKDKTKGGGRERDAGRDAGNPAQPSQNKKPKKTGQPHRNNNPPHQKKTFSVCVACA